jgi:hypothetical protein
MMMPTVPIVMNVHVFHIVSCSSAYAFVYTRRHQCQLAATPATTCPIAIVHKEQRSQVNLNKVSKKRQLKILQLVDLTHRSKTQCAESDMQAACA